MTFADIDPVLDDGEEEPPDAPLSIVPDVFIVPTTSREVVDREHAFQEIKVERSSDVADSIDHPNPDNEQGSRAENLTMGGASLATYHVFTGQITPASDATPKQLIDELVQIVGVDGPVLGERLHQAHVRASGGRRVGGQIAHALNSAIMRAKNEGLLIEDDPLSEGGVKPKTYRLLSQPEGLLRELGPRTLDQVPPRELAAVLANLASENGWSDEEALFSGAGSLRNTPIHH